MTGGLLSISIIIFIIAGFASMISNTLQRTSIASSLTTIKQSDPPLVTINPGVQGMYMLGLSIQSWDLSYIVDLFQGPQFLSLEMNFIKLENVVPSFVAFQLQQCTKQHWSMMPEFNLNFDSFSVDKWACIPLNKPFPVQGSYTSQLSYEMVINVFKCQNSTLNNNSCASSQDIDNLFSTYQNFYLTYNYINPVINANLQNYISYYIEGNDYIIFSKDIGGQAWVYYSDYQINTDNSIWPFTQITTEKGCIVEQKGINHPFSVSNQSSLASVTIAKSVNSLKYTRQVQKISAVFSYIGGLVGALTAFLFVINFYTNSSLQVTIGLNLFKQNNKQDLGRQQEAESFNILCFIKLTIYHFLKSFGWEGRWQIPARIQKFQNEAVKQLDVQLFLKRLIKLQFCMTYLFSPQQLEQIRELETITIDNAKKMRILLLKKEYQKQKDQSEILIPSAISIANQNKIKQTIDQVPYSKVEVHNSMEQQKISDISLNNTNFIMFPQKIQIRNDKKSSMFKSLKIDFYRQKLDRNDI